jgi:hypothetical protein
VSKVNRCHKDQNEGTWHHIAGTFSRPNINLYVNSVLEATAIHNYDLDYDPRPIFIGRSGECGGDGEGYWDAYLNSVFE